MENLRVVFDLSSNGVHKEMRIAPPYEWLVWFMGSSIGHSVRAAVRNLKHLRAALDGTPTPELGVTPYEVVADATTATFTDLYEEDRVRTYPTTRSLHATSLKRGGTAGDGKRDRRVVRKRHASTTSAGRGGSAYS